MQPTLTKAFDAPFGVYDVVAFKCYEWWATEEIDPTTHRPTGVAGHGLFRRKVGSVGVPSAVSGSDVRRFDTLGTFTRDDGTAMVVALGVPSSAVNYAGTFNISPPTGHVFLYTSTDGSTWTTYDLGPGTARDSYFLLYLSANRGFSDIDIDGKPGLGISTNQNWITFDGYQVAVTKFLSDAVAVGNDDGTPRAYGNSSTPLGGRVYLVDGVVLNDTPNTGFHKLFNNAGVLVEATYDPAAGSGDQIGVLNVIAPSLLDEPFCTNFHGLSVVRVSFKNGNLVAVASANGQWYFLGVPSSVTPATYRLLTLNALPVDPVTLDFNAAPVISETSPYPLVASQFAGICLRAIGTRLYAFNRRDFIIGGLASGYQPVLVALVNPNVSDLYVTSSLALGPDDSDGALLGTLDGYLVSYSILSNTTSLLASLGAAILKLARQTIGAVNLTYAMTGSQIESLRDDVAGTDGLLVPTTIYSAAAGYTITDMFLASGNRLFVVSSNGTNSKVAVLNVSGVTASLIREDSYATTILTVASEYASFVRVFSNSTTGIEKLYNSSNVASATTVALLDNENVTATTSDSTYLWVGTAAGKLLQYDGTTWVLKGTVAHPPIANLAVQNGVVYIAVTDSYYDIFNCNGSNAIAETDLANSGGWSSGNCASASTGFLFQTTRLVTTTRGISVVPDCNGGGGGTGGGTPTHRRLVLIPQTQDVPVKDVCIQLTGVPIDTAQNDYRCYVRVDNEAASATDFGSYQVALPGGWTQLHKPGWVTRIAIAVPIGEKFPALEVAYHRVTD